MINTFLSYPQIQVFCWFQFLILLLQRAWESRADGFFYFKQEEKDSDEVIPAKLLAEQTIEYARELEMIV